MRTNISCILNVVYRALVVGLAVPLPKSFRISVREYRPFNTSLLNVTTFSTGGIIAGPSVQIACYKPGVLSIDILIHVIPQLRDLSNVPWSPKLDSPHCQGVVVTHDTDTLEKLTSFLDLTLRSKKPIAVVGAMRYATAISANGPIDLLKAVTPAAELDARGRGAMIVLSKPHRERFFKTKGNANSLDTFYFRSRSTPSEAVLRHENATSLPQVEILGLRLAGMGVGTWTSEGLDVIDYIVWIRGTVVIDLRWSMDGYVPPYMRIMLQLALNARYTGTQMRSLFKLDA
ncbi:L-asparaginase [Daldinia eschscholtzii]|nr:L-asparaginase [Daldinia eschscholtzii]